MWIKALRNNDHNLISLIPASHFTPLKLIPTPQKYLTNQEDLVFVHFPSADPGFDELLLKKLGAEGVWKYTTLNFSPWIIYSLLLSPSTKDKVRNPIFFHFPSDFTTHYFLLHLLFNGLPCG